MNTILKTILEVLQQKQESSGSNPGGVYVDDKTNEKFHMKFPQVDPDQVKTELLSSRIQEMMGINNYNPQFINHEGEDGIISKWREGDAPLKTKDIAGLTPEQQHQIGRAFAHAVLTKNWDVVGTGVDYGSGNLRFHDNKIHSIDPGGSFNFRAQGGHKNYDDNISEINTLRDPNINRDSAKVFNGVFSKNPEALQHGIYAAENLDMNEVKKAFKSSGLYDWEDMYNTFSSRRKKFLSQMKGSKYVSESVLHPQLDEYGSPVELFQPHEDSPLHHWHDSNEIAHIVPNGNRPLVLNGIRFSEYHPPRDWNSVDGQGNFSEPPLNVPPRKALATGVIIHEPDGRIWAISPSNRFGGYENSIGPKGKLERGLNPRANAIKEALEETGLKVELLGHAADSDRTTSMTRYYHARRVGGDPAKMGWETQRVSLVPSSRLEGHLDNPLDLKIVNVLRGK